MPRIASPLPESATPSGDAGFTLTELIAGLLVASLLMAGMIDIIRRYARTTDDVRDASQELRVANLADAFLADIERVDPGTLSVRPQELEGKLGGAPIRGQIVSSNGSALLQWMSPVASRVVPLPQDARFALLSSGDVAIVQGDGGPPLAIARPRRTLPFDCQFDTVSRECRK